VPGRKAEKGVEPGRSVGDPADPPEGSQPPLNTARLRLRRRRNGRRLHALILLVGIVLVTGLAIGSRSGRGVGGPGSESDVGMAASRWVGADWSAIGSAGGPTDSWAGIFPAADSPAASPARLPGGSQGDAHSQAGAPL